MSRMLSAVVVAIVMLVGSASAAQGQADTTSQQLASFTWQSGCQSSFVQVMRVGYPNGQQLTTLAYHVTNCGTVVASGGGDIANSSYSVSKQNVHVLNSGAVSVQWTPTSDSVWQFSGTWNESTPSTTTRTVENAARQSALVSGSVSGWTVPSNTLGQVWTQVRSVR